MKTIVNHAEFIEAFHDYLFSFTNLDNQTKDVYNAIADITSDISNLWDKEWLKESIISNLYTGYFKETYRKEFIGRCVDKYFQALIDRHFNATEENDE
jgi:hypothetical protein